MPSRKKDRGRQRKAAKQNGNAILGLHERKIPSPEAELVVWKLKSEGCRITRSDDGGTTIRHPCFEHVKDKSTFDAVDNMGNFDRGLLTDVQRQELAENYVHNYAQDMREGGDLDGTQVILLNIADPHIGAQLRHELLKADLHRSILHLLNQSSKPVSSTSRKRLDVGESIKLPFCWVNMLGMLTMDGISEDTKDNARIALARGIEPFVMSMIDDKRELFRSNHIWHKCLLCFFQLMREILRSKGGFLAMTSYNGFLPFVAQASCWSQSREDIVAERELLRSRSPDAAITPEPMDIACREAQIVLCVVLYVHEDIEKAEMNRALDQIACTPLLSNDAKCDDSTLVGLIRMMSTKSYEEDRRMLVGVIEPLLLRHGYVDSQVIAELIEYGKDNSSVDTAGTVLNMMASILGQNEEYDHIEPIDSRYAAAIRHGLLEFGIDALIEYCDESHNKKIHNISEGLCLMAMHSKTSRALRGRKAEITKALDVLRKKSAPQSDAICSLVDDAIEASSPATCCNCLQTIDRKKLLYCQRCNLECYCSLACQSESFALGHDKFCKEEVHFFDSMREGGLNETELKRLAVLSNNLMMNGCRCVRSNMAEILDSPVEAEQQVTKVTINFGHCPPGIKVSRNDAGECSGSVKCAFVAPVYYGFAQKVDWDVSKEDVLQETTISVRHLAQLCSPNTAGQQK